MKIALGFEWLKQYMPRSIYGRSALILLLPVFTVTLVVTVMFLQRHFEDVARQMTSSAAREMAFISRRIDWAGDAMTAQLAGSQIAAPLGMTLRMPAQPVSDGRVFYDLSGRIVAGELRAHLPGVTGIDLSDLKEVTVSLTGRWGDYTLSFPRSRVSASNPHQLLVLMLFTSALMTFIATLFLRNQLRPIRRLARAAEDYGKGRVTPYKPGGAVEIRSAGAAFLDMRNRLERHAEQRGMMLTGISHDLRTPLTRLGLGLSMLSPDLPPEEEEIAAMQGDVEEMSRMLNAFLAFARDVAQDGPAAQVEILPFVERIVADARRGGQEVSIGTVELGGAGTVTLRPDMLRRAIENLIGNAVRYGSRAEIDLIARGRLLCISVEDDGPGIEPDRFEEALRPFSRLDPARNRNRGEGVGLGLAIAADVARAHGGRLNLSRGARLGGLRAELALAR